MNLEQLVREILAGDLIAAREWVTDANREGLRWEMVARPTELSDREMSVAAAIAELLASRAGSEPPSWTAYIGPADSELVLDPGLEQMPRSYAKAKSEGPEPFRKRNLCALPDFLAVA